MPAFLEDGDNQEVITKSNFKPIWNVLTALKSHDDELSDALDEYRVNLGKNPRGIKESISDKIIFDLQRMLIKNSRMLCEQDWLKLPPKLGCFGLDYWNYSQKMGHSKVHGDYSEGPHRLGAWVSMQRVHYNQGTLSTEKAKRLDALPGWVWDIGESEWQKMYNQLVTFVAQTGSSRFFKKEFIHLQTNSLRGWIQRQRNNYNFSKDELVVNA